MLSVFVQLYYFSPLTLIQYKFKAYTSEHIEGFILIEFTKCNMLLKKNW